MFQAEWKLMACQKKGLQDILMFRPCLKEDIVGMEDQTAPSHWVWTLVLICGLWGVDVVCTVGYLERFWCQLVNLGQLWLALSRAVHRHRRTSLFADAFYALRPPLCHCYFLYRGSWICGVAFVGRQKQFIKISIVLNKRNICWPY